MENYIITIARGFGTGGKQIALKLAEELGIQCYENRILYLASEMSGVSETEFMRADEQLIEKGIGGKLRELPHQLLPLPVTKRFRSQDKLFDDQTKIIRRLADTESCIIVGKCADFVLKDRKNVISVYIEAPRDYCVKRIMRRMHCGESQAHALITKTDKYRAEYYKYYTHGNYWTNPVNYDLTLNSSRLGEDGCIEMIKACLKVRLGVEQRSVNADDAQ